MIERIKKIENGTNIIHLVVPLVFELLKIETSTNSSIQNINLEQSKLNYHFMCQKIKINSTVMYVITLRQPFTDVMGSQH